MPRRTAVLVDVTAFGVLGEGEPDPGRPKPLPFGADVTAFGAALTSCGYTVLRPKGPGGSDLTSDELGSEINAVIDGHSEGDVVVVHVMSHGWLHSRVDSLCIMGSDGVKNSDADVVEWVRDCSKRVDGPHVLFLLDVCFAGQAADADARMRRMEPDKVWILAASESGQSAFEARFTKALTTVLRGIDAARHLPYVPLDTFAIAVNDEVQRLSGDGARQRVTGSEIRLTTEVAGLPFFANPRFSLSEVGRSEISELPAVPGAAHFLAAARCHAADGRARGDFTGRAMQLHQLASWLGDESAPAFHAVTGRAGTGKSALLGVLVCAAHPALADGTRPLLAHLSGLPPRQDRLAAVHARHRDVHGFVDSLAAQLFGVHDVHTPAALVERLSGRPAVIVADALDEAAAPDAVLTELLVPLAEAGCRVLVATRSSASITSRVLELAGAVVDLDDVGRTALRNDIEDYAMALLRESGYGDHGPARISIAEGIAVTLTSGPVAWGEFLVTRLYVQHVIDHVAPVTDAAEARALGEAVPRDLAAVFELDPRVRQGTSWVRPVLAALALARGFGMPAQLVPALAGVCAGLPSVPTDAEVAAVLNATGIYLRVLPGDSGVALYQLVHDGLADHLRTYPVRSGSPGPVDPEDVYRALLSTVRVNSAGVRLWERAIPYVRRHVLDFAGPELLRDPDYLLSPGVRDAVAEVAPRSAALAVVEAREAGFVPLAVVAARHGGAELARALSDRAGCLLRPVFAATAAPVRTAQGLLAVADGTTTVRVYEIGSEMRELHSIRHRGSVRTVAMSRHNGVPEVIMGGSDGTARVFPLGAQDSPRLQLSHGEAVDAVAVVEHEGHLAVATAGGRAMRFWNARDGEPEGAEFYDSGVDRFVPVLLADGTSQIAARIGSSITLRGKLILEQYGLPEHAYVIEGSSGFTALSADEVTQELMATISLPSPARGVGLLEHSHKQIFEVTAGFGFGGVIVVTVEGGVEQVHHVLPSGHATSRTFRVSDGTPRRLWVMSRDDWAAVVVRDRRGVRAWHPLTGAQLSVPATLLLNEELDCVLVGDELLLAQDLQARLSPGGALSAWRREGVPLAVTAASDGVRLWNLDTEAQLDHLPLPAVAVKAVPPHHVVVQTEEDVIVLEYPQEAS